VPFPASFSAHQLEGDGVDGHEVFVFVAFIPQLLAQLDNDLPELSLKSPRSPATSVFTFELGLPGAGLCVLSPVSGLSGSAET